jgi:integrase
MSTGVYKRGKTWSYKVELGRNPVTGERRMKIVGGFPTSKKAQSARAVAVAHLATGAYVEPAKDTLREYLLDRWLPAIEARGLRSSTAYSYRMLIEKYCVPHLGHVPLQKVDGMAVTAMYVALGREGKVKSTGGLAPKTIRNLHGVLGKAFRDAVRWGVLVRNPIDAADPPRRADVEMKSWTADQVGTFLRAAEADRLAGLWRLEAMTGMRRGELVALRWSDVDLDAGRLHVRQAAGVVTGVGVVVERPKTAKGTRSISLDEATRAALRQHRRRQLEERMAAGPAWVDTGLVFTHPDGTMFHPGRITKTFRLLLERAGLPPIRLHDMRHSHASLLLGNGVPVKVVSERLGHAQASVTLNVYQHVLPGADEEAAETAARLVLGDGGVANG